MGIALHSVCEAIGRGVEQSVLDLNTIDLSRADLPTDRNL